MADRTARWTVLLGAFLVILAAAWLSRLWELDSWAHYGLRGVVLVGCVAAVHVGLAPWPDSEAPAPQAESELSALRADPSSILR